MILILSEPFFETTTEAVIDWLNYYKIDFVRLNPHEFYDDLSLELVNGQFDFGNEFDDVKAIWYRRFPSMEKTEIDLQSINLSAANLLAFYEHIKKESLSIKKLFLTSFLNVKWLTHYKELQHSKLEVLSYAQKIGLKSPKTLITTKKSALIEFQKKHTNIITKTITQGIPNYNVDGTHLSLQTAEITEDDLTNLPETFGLSLFQNKVEKIYEIRSFYLDGNFYSMCIFSQLDTQTTLDFRNYNYDKPNRTVPYQLPKHIEILLLKIVNHFNYTTGSFDLIRSKTGEYIFLEINPNGQIGMTSLPCNYQLEHEISKYLVTE